MFPQRTTDPRWMTIYNEIKTYDVDDVLSYEKLVEITEAEEVGAVRVDVYRAIKELEIEHKRTMECVRGVGYRVVRANEHERLVRRDIRSIKRKSRKAHSKTINVRRSELTMEERRSIDDLQLKMAQHEEMLNRLNRRADRHEELIKQARWETKESTAQLLERLSAVEQELRDQKIGPK